MHRLLTLLNVPLVAISACCLVACNQGSDNSSRSDGSAYPDLGQAPDFAQKAPCESEWIDALGAQQRASTGEVTTVPSGEIFKTTIDATAGGSAGAAQNPFVYVSLANGSRVNISDIEARSSLAWDLAFKRTVIRVNGGDSGSGQGAAAAISGKTIEDVSSAPPASAFRTDDFLDEQCNVARDPINQVQTAFSGSDLSQLWYEYDVGGQQAVKPRPWVYVIKRADGSLAKLVIDAYYDSHGTSGHFTIYWAAL